MANTIKVKLGYSDTEATRTYTLNEVSDEALTPASVRAAVSRFNTKLNAVYENMTGQQIWLSDDNHTCSGVLEVIGESVTETEVSLSGGES